MNPSERERSLERELTFLREDYAEIQGQMVEMQAAAHELIGTQAKIDSLINGVSEGIIILRPDQTVQTFNHMAELIFGYRQETLLGHCIDCLFALPEAFEGRITDYLTDYCNRTVDMLENPLWGKRKGGDRVPLRATVSQVASNDMVLFDDESLMEEDGGPGFDLFICLLHDLSGELRTHHLLEKQRESLLLANRAKDEFLSRVSHELRTPLNGILPIAELLQEAGLADDLRGFVDTIVEAGRDLAAIIDEILDFSAVERKGVNVNPAPMRLDDLLEEIRQVFLQTAQAKGIALDVELDPAVPAWIECDREVLHRILSTLVENAVKFTNEGAVRIGAEAVSDGERLRLHVIDSGIGIAENALPNLFSSFSQDSEYLTREFGGTGIGLALASRFVKALEGSVEVFSTPGEGSEFRVELPLREVTKPSGMDAGLVLDQATLDDLAEVVGDELADLLDTYLNDAQNYLDSITAWHKAGDPRALGSALAGLREASHSVGAVGLAAVCDREGPFDDDSVDSLATELSRVKAQIQDYLSRVNL